jgi:hypothetical protein
MLAIITAEASKSTIPGPSYKPIQQANVIGMSYTIECEQKEWDDLKELP